MPDYSIRVEVPLVNLDVLVTTKDGQTIPGLKKENFKILEDGAAAEDLHLQSDRRRRSRPCCWSNLRLTDVRELQQYYYMYDALNASYTFASGLKKDDWVAVISYDMKPQILVDFTQDKRAVYAALNQLRIPGFAETQPVRRAVRHARPARSHRGQEVHHSGHRRESTLSAS